MKKLRRAHKEREMMDKRWKSLLMGNNDSDRVWCVYWQSNNSCFKCNSCSRQFSWLIRKHHCRACGFIYCYLCCGFKLKKKRVCNVCLGHLESLQSMSKHKKAMSSDTFTFGPSILSEEHLNRKVLVFIESMEQYQLKSRPNVLPSPITQNSISQSLQERLCKHVGSNYSNNIDANLLDRMFSISSFVCNTFFENSLYPAPSLPDWSQVVTISKHYDYFQDPSGISSFAGVSLLHRTSRRLEAPLTLKSAKILLISGNLEFLQSPVSEHNAAPLLSLSNIDSEKSLFYENLLMKIVQLKPNVVICTGFICGEMQALLNEAGIVFLSQVSDSCFSRIVFACQAQVCGLLDLIRNIHTLSPLKDRLGVCSFSIYPHKLDPKDSKSLVIFGTCTKHFSIVLFRDSYQLASELHQIMESMLLNVFSNYCEESLMKDQCAKWEGEHPKLLRHGARETFAWSLLQSGTPHPPKIVSSHLYHNDLSLGDFLFANFFDSEHSHSVVLSHRSGQITFELQRFPSNLLAEPSRCVVTWGRCRICGFKVTPVTKLSKPTFFLSFARYLMLLVSDSTMAVSSCSKCTHSVFKQHTRFFGFYDKVVSCSFDTRKPYRLVVANRPVSAPSPKTLKRFFRQYLKRAQNIFLRCSKDYSEAENCIQDCDELEKLQVTICQRQIQWEKSFEESFQNGCALFELAKQFTEVLSIVQEHVSGLQRLVKKVDEFSPNLELSRSLSECIDYGPSSEAIESLHRLDNRIKDWIPSLLKSHRLFKASWIRDSNVPIVTESDCTFIAHLLSLTSFSNTLSDIGMKYDQEDTFEHSIGNVKVISYFSSQFHHVRQILCGGLDSFTNSIWDTSSWNADGGKSGSPFLKTTDGKLVLKEISSKELKVFQAIGFEYFSFLYDTLCESLPSTLLPILGIFKVYRDEGSRIFLAMPNLFHYQSSAIVFDLKGIYSRSPPEKEGSSRSRVLFDKNFIQFSKGLPIPLAGNRRIWLQRALERDTKFLNDQSIMDYSLLVGMSLSSSSNEPSVGGKIFIGMIDYLNQFTIEKQLETKFKSMFAKEPTVVHPKKYRSRFLKAMKAYFLF